MAAKPYARDENRSQNSGVPVHLVTDPAAEVRTERQRRHERMAAARLKAERAARGLTGDEQPTVDPDTYLAIWRQGADAMAAAMGLRAEMEAPPPRADLRLVTPPPVKRQ